MSTGPTDSAQQSPFANTKPSNLYEWRKPINLGKPSELYTLRWEPFVKQFRAFGYELFENVDNIPIAAGPGGKVAVRPEDQYHFSFHPRQAKWVTMHGRKHIPATRLSDGIWVLIQIVTLGEDGKNELEILRYLDEHKDPKNPFLPLLEELAIDDKVFAVFPLVDGGSFTSFKFADVDDALSAIGQILDGLDFLHKHNIAHRDLGTGDLLENHLSPWNGKYRHLFPIKWYIIDYQYSTLYRERSLTSPALEKSFPFFRYNYVKEDYGKFIPPEFLTNELYDPFKADVYQLGKSLEEALDEGNGFATHAADVMELFRDMGQENVDLRPTMSQVAARFAQIRDQYTSETLQQVLVHT